MYIRNAWYAAAWSSEVADGLLGRRILDEPVLLFRGTGGRIAALDNRCPPRFAPLSAGRNVDGVVECRYHGLRFDGGGACVGGLGGQFPRDASIRAYPAVERHGLVWIWMGEPTLADPDQIADLGFMQRGPEAPVTRYIHLKCDYRLATDNLMDLSHAAVLHDETLGRLTPTLGDGALSVTREGDCVHASTRMCGVRLAPDAAPVDQWIDMRWHPPGAMIIDLVAAPEGSERPAFGGGACHVLTPETTTTTHYFTGAPTRRRHPFDFPRDPFTDEDGPMLAACQEMMGGAEFWDLNPLILPNDAAAIGVRRVIEQRLKKEAAAKRSTAA